MKKLTLLTAMVCLVLTACQKNNTPQPEATAPKSINAAALAASADCLRRPAATDVYVTGEYQPTGVQPSAIYWKNGTTVNLTPVGSGSEAAGIAVKGNDVYVAGDALINGLRQAVYWKNGVMHPLNYGQSTNFASFGLDIAVEGNDVYVVGDYTDLALQGKSQAILWKNSQPHNLSYNQFGSGAHAVKVKGNDVYVSGYSALDNTVFYIATYWKNGFAHRLENNTGFSFTNGMALNGNDVYIAGNTFPTANAVETLVYWKNGIRTNIQTGAAAGGIAIGGNNVYIAGTATIDLNTFQFQAAYWKNSIPTLLGAIGGSNFGRDIQVAGNDVYLLAIEANVAEYFKNGVGVTIPDVNPSRILVVQH